MSGHRYIVEGMANAAKRLRSGQAKSATRAPDGFSASAISAGLLVVGILTLRPVGLTGLAWCWISRLDELCVK